MTAVDLRLDHLAIALDHAATPDRWPVTPRFTPDRRWYHRLAVAPDHEVWLLTWLPGQSTDLHDHGGSAGAFHVHAGTLTEEVVTEDPTPRISVQAWVAGTGHRFGDRHIHRITNRSTRPAVSIHVYGPALTTMTRYQVRPDGLDVLAVERAGVQW